MSSEIESNAVVGTSNERIARSLGHVWDSMPCNDAMRCMRACWGHGFAREGAFVYICMLSPPQSLSAQSRHWFLRTYIHSTSNKDVTRLDDEEGRQRGNFPSLLLIWSRGVQSGRRFMQVEALK